LENSGKIGEKEWEEGKLWNWWLLLKISFAMMHTNRDGESKYEKMFRYRCLTRVWVVKKNCDQPGSAGITPKGLNCWKGPQA